MHYKNYIISKISGFDKIHATRQNSKIPYIPSVRPHWETFLAASFSSIEEIEET